MAQFKLVTICDTTDKITVNLDSVRYIQDGNGYAVIHFSKDHNIAVNENSDHIMMSATLRNL